MPGHEELVSRLAFDGRTGPEQAAVQILAAEKMVRRNAAQKLGKDGIAPLAHAEPPVVAAADVEDKTLPIEDRVKAAWEKDAGIRSEFGSDYDAYLAYRRAAEKGQVRVLKK